jgi:hypothetical protein
MAFLDYLLGGVSGGFEGYERKKARELQAQKDEEERQVRLASLFSQGFEPVADVQRKKQAAIGAAGSLIGSALSAASGGPILSPPSMADQEALGQGYATAKPERTMTFGGQQLALRETATERQDRLAREAEMRQRRAAEDVANAAIQAKKNRIESLVASGLTRAQAVQAVELDAKYGDVSETPSVLATKRGQDISAATTRRGQDISAATTRRGQDLANQRKDAEGVNEIQSGLQAMGVARASSSLNLLETNTKLMDRFEKDVLDGKAQITALQLETARFALSGGKGSAVAEDRLAKGIPGLMPPNPALLRYVRAGKGISGAVREITPRGGSNLMMQMEQTLAGIGPAGTDAESIGQVQTFRNDILAGVREGVMAMRGTKPSTQSGRPPLSSFKR